MSRYPVEVALIVRTFAVLAEPTRLRLLRLLRQQEELCVCELVDALQLPQYAVSRHLCSLRSIGLVEARRNGKWMHYRLAPAAARAPFARGLLDLLDREMQQIAIRSQDDARLARRLGLRRSGQCVVGICGPCGTATKGSAGALRSGPASGGSPAPVRRTRARPAGS